MNSQIEKLLPLILSALAVVLAIFLPHDSNTAETRQEIIVGEVGQEIVAGVIRSQDERGWYAINDESHKSINIESVVAAKGLIIVRFSKEFKSINTFIAVPDETFSRDGIFLGSSVNRRLAKISVSKVQNGKVVPIDAATIKSRWGNIWLYGLFER